MTIKQLSRRQARWAERLTIFNFEFYYRPERINPADDLLKRLNYES
jgi:hypothetical protein